MSPMAVNPVSPTDYQVLSSFWATQIQGDKLVKTNTKYIENNDAITVENMNYVTYNRFGQKQSHNMVGSTVDVTA